VVFDVVAQIADALVDVGAKSVAIGIEQGISADDTPFVRIVPFEEESEEFAKAGLSFGVYVGTDIVDDMAQTYKEHMDMVERIKSALSFTQWNGGVCYYKGTKFDRDIVKHYKVALVEFEIKGMAQ